VVKALFPTVPSLETGFATEAKAASITGKQLRVFIHADQSNVVGHANYLTLPSLLTAKGPGLKCNLVKVGIPPDGSTFDAFRFDYGASAKARVDFTEDRQTALVVMPTQQQFISQSLTPKG